jgi:Flp pilus assembly pilin Flp
LAPFAGAAKRLIRVVTAAHPNPGRETRGAAAVRTLRAFVAAEEGSSAAEYAILLFVLSGCAIFILHSLGHKADRAFLGAAKVLSAR